MANERNAQSDELKKSPSEEQVRKEGEPDPKEREMSEKVKEDQATDDRFQATDN
jgi:hypothetical protein